MQNLVGTSPLTVIENKGLSLFRETDLFSPDESSGQDNMEVRLVVFSRSLEAMDVSTKGLVRTQDQYNIDFDHGHPTLWWLLWI